MNYFEIPLSPIPQVFAISLGGDDYRLTLQYRDGWILDVADDLGQPLVSGIPLVTGLNLLGQYQHLGFAGGLRVTGAESPDDAPTSADLGRGAKLYWVAD